MAARSVIGGRALAAVVRIVALAIAMAGAPSAQAQDAPTVRVLIKFAPEQGVAATGHVQFDPASCPACVQRHDPAYERFNPREAVLQFDVPRGRFLQLAFDIAPDQARRVIVNDSDLPTQRAGRRLLVELPPLFADALWAPAFETDIVETGMVLRFEHADIARRGGAYATGRFPATERRAADNLTFAQREVVRRLGLGDYVERERIGRIMLMGFDTNFPAGHTDAPPHIHMHMRWANNVGTQISHFYLNEQGLLTENRVGVRALGSGQQRLGRGETYWTIDNRGRRVYAHTINVDGSLLIDTPDGRQCHLRPVSTGFDSGASVDCGAAGSTTIRVSDDLDRGILTVQTGNIVETIRYDRDTGTLLSPPDAPDDPASAKNPMIP